MTPWRTHTRAVNEEPHPFGGTSEEEGVAETTRDDLTIIPIPRPPVPLVAQR